MGCCCSNMLKTLLWKNYRLKRARYVSSCCELLAPVFVVIIVTFLLSSSSVETFEEGWSPNSASCGVGICRTDFEAYTARAEGFDLILDGLNGREQIHRHAKLFLAGDNASTLAEFVDYMVQNGTRNTRHPELKDRIFIMGSGSVKELETYARSSSYGDSFDVNNPEIRAAIVFHKMDFENAQFDYSIRLNTTQDVSFQAPFTSGAKEIQDGFEINWKNALPYINGLVPLQLAVDEFIIDTVGKRAEDALGRNSTFDRKGHLPGNFSATPFPRSVYQSNSLFSGIAQILPLIFIIAYIVPVSQITGLLVLEKELRTKALLKTMGVNEVNIISSWYLTYFVYFLLLSLMFTVLGPGQFPKTAEVGGPLSMVLFSTFFLQGLTVMAFSFLTSTFFGKSFNSVVGTLCLYLCLFFPYFYVTTLPVKDPWWLLFPQVAFSLIIETISFFEAEATGVDFTIADTERNGFAVTTGLRWLFIDFLLYTLFAGYLNVVIPREFGRALPWYFPVLPSFWKSLLGASKRQTQLAEQFALGPSEKEENPPETIEVSVDSAKEEPGSLDEVVYVEGVEESLLQQKRRGLGMQIRNLTKVFDTRDGKKVAVDGLNMDIYEGQILVLLGHNGAGKTTTLEMLSGMTRPTSGDAMLYGFKLSSELAYIRKSLGFCPQHDVLYPELTVMQHLCFYGKLKGLNGLDLSEAVATAVSNVGLEEKVHEKSRALSGGMKRKLSLAIALIGDSKIVFVDEPTSGVDPWSRRNMWEIIQNHREGRVIILTTHFMDEADLLGDRIAIMSEGKLKCCGSSLYLKQVYDAGYKLTFVKGKACDVNGIVSLVESVIPESRLVADVGTELSMEVPIASSERFPDLLDSVEKAMDGKQLGIDQYGISVSTLEEVFFKAGSSADTIGVMFTTDEEQGKTGIEVSSSQMEIELERPSNSSWRHFKALFIKRLLYARRDPRAFACNTILPLLILSIGLLLLTLGGDQDEPSLLFTAEIFNPGYTPNAFLPTQEFDEFGNPLNLGETELLSEEFIKDFELEDPEINPYPEQVRTVFDSTYVDGKFCPSYLGVSTCKTRFPAFNRTLNAILDTSLYVLKDESAQKKRNGASLYTAALGQRIMQTETSKGGNTCFQLAGASPFGWSGDLLFDYATKVCQDGCLSMEASINGVTQCLPVGCSKDVLSNNALALFDEYNGRDAYSFVRFGNVSMFRCFDGDGKVCNAGPATLRDRNPCRGNFIVEDEPCVASHLSSVEVVPNPLNPEIFELGLHDPLELGTCRRVAPPPGPFRVCQQSGSLGTFKALLDLLTGQETLDDVYNASLNSCKNLSLSCEMSILFRSNGKTTCSPLSCMDDLPNALAAIASPTIAPLMVPIFGSLSTENCSTPVHCDNVIDPGFLAPILANASAASPGRRRLVQDEKRRKRRLATTGCNGRTETCNVIELNSVCLDISCSVEAETTLRNALGEYAGLAVLSIIQDLPRRGIECDFAGCSSTLDLKNDLNPVEAQLLSHEVAPLLLEYFARLLNQTGLESSKMDLEGLYDVTNSSMIEALFEVVDILGTVLDGPDGVDIDQLITLSGLSPSDVLAQYAAQILVGRGDLPDPTVFKSLLGEPENNVTCQYLFEECVLAEFSDVPQLGSMCFAQGCDTEYIPIGFGAPKLFKCNVDDCNRGCAPPNNCQTNIRMTPVKKFRVSLVPAPEHCPVEPETTRFSTFAMVNDTALHGIPLVANTVNTAILRYTLKKLGRNHTSADIKVRSHPLPITALRRQFASTLVAFQSAVIFVFAFSFICPPAIQFVVLERQEERNVKHLQFVSGVSIISYWTTFYAFDVTAYMVPFLGSIASMVFFDVEVFVKNLNAVILVLLGYGLAVIPFNYALSFLFKKPTTALIWSFLINLITGIILMFVVFTLKITLGMEDAVKSMKFIFRLFPGFCLGDSLLQLALNDESASSVFDPLSQRKATNALDADITGLNVTYLFVEAVALMILIIVYETMRTRPGAVKQIRDTLEHRTILDGSNVDEDVAVEEERVATGGADGDALILKNLRKVYSGGKVAVQNVSLGVPEGECLGYLGTNGAGKTTTLKMITGDTFPTSGSGKLNGYDLVYDQLHVRQHVGYCSQFSALLNRLTVREHLELFCRIKHARDIDQSVETLLDRLALRPFAGKLAGSLSGGNQRKLSVAIAMIGSPSVLLLDEPSTGMDVVSKRFMWNVIEDLSSGKFNGKKTSVVLTTHSMEECEALCSRVGIMVNGRLQCLGSIQHLKARFGKGFMLELKLNLPEKSDIKKLVQEYNIPEIVQILANPQDIDSGLAVSLKELSARLGEPERYKLLMPEDTQREFLSSIEKNGMTDAIFAEWWLNQDAYGRLNEFFQGSFPGYQLLERHNSKLRYSLPKEDDMKLSTLFSMLEDNTARLGVAEYSVSQTTLEQIFNEFARKQEEL